MVAISKELDAYASGHTSPDSPAAKEIFEQTQNGVDYAHMLAGQPLARLLQLLIRLSQAKKVLEVGFFTGYTALSMAEAVGEGGVVESIEGRPDLAETGRAFLKDKPCGEKVRILEGEALNILPTLSGPYDLIFIDANKRMYPFFYPLCLDLVRKGGIIVLDNMLWWGKVLEPKDQDSYLLDELNKSITDDPDVDNILLTVRDGVQIVVKK